MRPRGKNGRFATSRAPAAADDCRISPSLRETSSSDAALTPQQVRDNLEAVSSVVECYRLLTRRVVNDAELKKLLDGNTARHLPYSIAERVKALRSLMDEVKDRSKLALAKQAKLMQLEKLLSATFGFTHVGDGFVPVAADEVGKLQGLFMEGQLGYGSVPLAAFLMSNHEAFCRALGVDDEGTLGFLSVMYDPARHEFFVTYPTNDSSKDTVRFELSPERFDAHHMVVTNTSMLPQGAITLFSGMPDAAAQIMQLRQRLGTDRGTRRTGTTYSEYRIADRSQQRYATATNRLASTRSGARSRSPVTTSR